MQQNNYRTFYKTNIEAKNFRKGILDNNRLTYEDQEE
jgi:hypothetical protein